MPALSSNAATLQRGGFNFTGFLSVLPQTVVLTGAVSATPTFPALTIAYTVSSGSHSNVRTGMTVNVFSSLGVRKGQLRVATGGSITNVSLPVNEFAQGTVNVVSGDTFQVIDEWRIWDKLVSATAALNKDSRIAYSDQGSNPNPVCNSGGPVAGFSTSLNFYGSTSYVIDPDSSSVSHAWDFVDATPSSSVSANPAAVVFPVGFRWVTHVLTDDTNSKTSTQRIPVWVHDRSTYLPLAVQIDSLSANVDDGWRCTFKLPASDEASISNLPDGSLVVYWEKEVYNGTEVSYGSQVTGRSHIKFAGYIVSDSIHIDPDSNEVIFEAVSPLAILAQTPALPQLMVNKASPAKWSELKTLTTKKMFWYLANWGSNLLDAWDFIWNDGVDLSYQRISVEGDTIAAQLRDIANSLNVQVTCDRLGRILFTRDPGFLSTSDRSSRTTTYDLTTADIMEVDITRNHRGTTKTVRGEGITPAGKAVFSNAPGNAPASFGPASDTLAKQIVASQASMNTRAGLYFARVNGLYNGQFVPKGGRLTLPDGYDVFEPAYREFSTLTLPATLNGRAVEWDDTTKWTVEGVNISYDIETGAKAIDITIDHETYGPDGVTYIPPPEAANGVISYPPIDVQYPNLPVDPYIDINGNPIIPTGTTSGNECEVWSADAAWLAENVLNLTEPPFGVNTPTDATEIFNFQWVNLGSPGAYILFTVDGVDSLFGYSADYPADGASWELTSVTGIYNKIRVGSTQGVAYILTDQTVNDPFLVTFDGLNYTDYTISYGTETGGHLDVVAHVFGGGGGYGCLLEIDLGQELAIGDVSFDTLLSNGRVDHAVSIAVTLYDSAHVQVDVVAGDYLGVADGNPNSSTHDFLGTVAQFVEVSVAWLDAGSPNSGWIDNIEVAATTSGLSTRYTDDFGATFDSLVSVGTTGGTFTGFDTSKRGAVDLIGTAGQVVKSSAGGVYAAYGTTLPSGFIPSAIWIPDKQLTTSSTANNTTSPEFIIMSEVEDDDGATLYRCTAGGNTFFDVTPVIGSDKGLAVSADCIAMPYRSGKYIAVVADFGGTVHCVVSKDTGATWLDRGTASNANYIRFRRGDLTLQQLFIASSGGAIITSQNLGVDFASKLSPDGAALIGCEPFG